MLLLALSQAIPRKLWLSADGKQLVQWPVEELKALRAKHVNVTDKVIKKGNYFEVTGFKSVQVSGAHSNIH